MIHQCTRPYKKRRACLDNIMTSYDSEMQSGTLNMLVSDHLPVYRVKLLQSSVVSENTVTTRSYRDFDAELFLDWLAEANWDDYYGLDDPSAAWSFIQEHIEGFLDNVCPVTTKVVRDKNG